ncbi:hypothetical protein BH20ACT9_BH20ACT9_13440 [soil metagenome]
MGLALLAPDSAWRQHLSAEVTAAVRALGARDVYTT